MAVPQDVSPHSASCPAQAGHPVLTTYRILRPSATHGPPWLLDHPLARVMTAQCAARAMLPPHLVGDLDDHAQLRPLLLVRERVAVLGRREAALRRERELVERHEFRRRLDAPLDVILALERAGLRRDEAEHHGLAARHEAQRLEPAGALAV